ncbi:MULTISPECIES: toxic anion resistance protein [unclassified Halomonas]|uniref:toxic anion resistance protein n=1 Tax=unclassified Halomonas TaxID=2609666 RepID=UPI0007D93DC0|nr:MULTISPECIES: toxic anion resistance protein [unclassified Halomonas]MBT2787874.1 toxic anion resistance protein [Halomonas sp. ISL-106]MBT2795623.1 toxic anion resistance protein [Halomonas sp. ISL-104]OAL60930.1 toxic anion resistance protein [Halomonas sp. ALS9]
MAQQSDDHPRLSLPPVEEIASQLGTSQAGSGDPELEAMADRFVKDILAEGNEASAVRQRRAVDEMGLELQQQAAHRSSMLQTPLRKLAHQGDEGGPVAKALTDLRGRMEGLDPSRHRLMPSALDRILAIIPGIDSRLQRYFHKFENAQQALDAIIEDLESGRDMLHRDNLTLSDDQKALNDILIELNRQIALGRLIDQRLCDEISARDGNDPRRQFLEEELLFPLRQRIVDLQQQLAVSQQGVLALEVIIRKNRELMRGVDRAINVTVSALTVAVTVAMAMANQRLVLDRVEALNTTTSQMIGGTAKALRQQGVDIQKRASSAMLDMQVLEEAFSEVMGAIDDLSSYRQEALPRLDEQINRLATLAKQGNASIERLQEGSDSQPKDGHAPTSFDNYS